MRYEHMSNSVRINLDDNTAFTHTLSRPMLQIENAEEFELFAYGGTDPWQGFIYSISLYTGRLDPHYTTFS